MQLRSRRTGLAFVTAVAAVAAWAPRSAQGQAAEPKTAEQVFKNIVELKGTPADQLMPGMQFIAASLGVECTFCHVQGKMELDEKPEKKTARAMIAMTMAINKNSFGGRLQVTCYSCHRGASHPVNVPAVLDSDAPPRNEPPAQTSAVTVDTVMEHYVAALGGAEAMRAVTSRSMKGSLAAGGRETPIEVFTKAPNKRISVSHMGESESYTAFDGTSGWLGNKGRPARDMTAAESSASALDAEFYLALRFKEIFPQLRLGRPEQIGGADCQTLIGSGAGHPPVRLYFDAGTGLLVRMVRYAETAVGRMPTQIDYADYRAADGVKIPFRWTLSRPNGRFTIQLAEVKCNVPLDDARFNKPAAESK